MDLFETDPRLNLLPEDGTVNYYGAIFDNAEASRLFNVLHSEIGWENDRLVMFGKEIVTARKVAWYGECGLSYGYSGTTKNAKAWTPELLGIQATIQSVTGEAFNSCLLNLYENGEQGMGWHSDDEKALRQHAPIASLSLGAERKFSFRHKTTKQGVSLVLQNGGLLIMKDETQSFWQHSIPKSKKVITPRINLTFRSIVP